MLGNRAPLQMTNSPELLSLVLFVRAPPHLFFFWDPFSAVPVLRQVARAMLSTWEAGSNLDRIQWEA